MNNTTRAAIVHLLLLQGLAAAACGDRGSVTGPSATVSVGVTAKISISGVVYDTAHRLITGARVEVIEGTVGDWCHHHGVQPAPVCIVDTVTDGSGLFSFEAPTEGVTFASVTRLRASMEGYLSATLTVDSTTSTSGIEFRLEPSVAP